MARKEPQYSRETITPDIAQQWLALNSHNRAMSQATVSRYARDMLADQWAFTGEPMHFNGKALINGQHRLRAIVKAAETNPKVKIDVLVIRDIDNAVQEKLDQGKMRSVHDILTLRGIDDGRALGAAARHLIGIKQGGNVLERATGRRPTNAEVLAMVEKHPGLPDSLGLIEHRAFGINPSLLAAIHYIGAKLLRDRETADSFVEVWSTGEPAYKGDPAHALRERLINQVGKKHSLKPSVRRYATIHAWNQFRRGDKVTSFRMPDDEVTVDGLNVDRL